MWNGGPYLPRSENGGLEVAVQDQYTEPINLHVSRFIQTIELTTGVAIDDNQISVTCVSAPVVGNYVCLKEDNSFYQGEIKTVTGTNPYTLTLTSPIDYSYSASGGCSEVSIAMNVNGTLANPIVFSVSPSNLVNNTRWHLTELTLQILSTSDVGDGLFGGLAKLANGIVIRRVNGKVKNFMNAKTNGDLRVHGFDVQYADKPPSGLYGVNATINIRVQLGIVIDLDAETNDTFEILVQDSLAGLSTFNVVARGHVTEN